MSMPWQRTLTLHRIEPDRAEQNIARTLCRTPARIPPYNKHPVSFIGLGSYGCFVGEPSSDLLGSGGGGVLNCMHACWLASQIERQIDGRVHVRIY